MNRSNSSTSSSDRTKPAWRESLRVALWFGLSMLLFDLAIGWKWHAPRDPRLEPNALQRYFEYGRSVEGKLRNSVAKDDPHSAPIALAGWLADPGAGAWPAVASSPQKLLVAGYGQSFTKHVLDAATRQDSRIEMRMLGGPAAPLSHSFKLYQRDRTAHSASVVVIGVLASALPQLTTMTTMTWAFEAPAPYTYPRYTLSGSRLHEVEPIIDSIGGLRAALAQPARWRAFRDQLRRYDAAFDPWVFDADVWDRSVLGRMIRRALCQRNQRRFTKLFHDDHGFINREGMLDLAVALLAEFAQSARADGRVPIVLLINDRGYGDDLVRALGPALTARGVAFLSTHTIAPASDPRSFLPDGHFRRDLDDRLGAAFLDRLRNVQPALHSEK